MPDNQGTVDTRERLAIYAKAGLMSLGKEVEMLQLKSGKNTE